MSENLESERSESKTMRIKVRAHRPYSGRKHVEVRRYADGTHETIDPALNADEMVGITVATITESRLETTTHSARPAKMGRSFLNGNRLLWSVSSTWPLRVALPVVYPCTMEEEDMVRGQGGAGYSLRARMVTRKEGMQDNTGDIEIDYRIYSEVHAKS
jgi:hypothetical protein